MLVAMVVIFGTSWFPINLINLVADSVDLGKNNNTMRQLLTIIFLCHVVAMSSTYYNPLFYGWFNSAFRSEINILCPYLAMDCRR